jgi:hypothetical protein
MPDDEPTEEPTAQERARRRDRPLVQRAIVSDALMDPEERERIGFDPSPEAPMPVVIELNLRHRDGLEGAAEQFLAHFQDRLGDRPVERVADTYFRAELTQAEILRLVDADQREPDAANRAIYRVWPDFPVHPLIDTSCATVKADAARRSFDATGRGITWAVLDSGIDAHHHHFHRYETLKGDVAGLHRDFTKPGEAVPGDALVDNFGHGTHVAGIIAGGLPARMPRGSSLRVVERVFDPARPDTPRVQDRTVSRPEVLAGMAREAKLVSLKVLDDRGNGQSMNVLRALEYVRKDVNGYGKLLRIHGVNLSLGYEFDPKWFACGQSPICAEVDRLVRSGVVVVVAAGNTGYGSLTSLATPPWPSPSAPPTGTCPTPTGCRTSPPRARPATAGSSRTWSPRASGSPPVPPARPWPAPSPTARHRRRPRWPCTWRTRAPAWPPRTCRGRWPTSCRSGGSSSAGPTRSSGSSASPRPRWTANATSRATAWST